MTTKTGLQETSDMISEDALLKFYPIFHGSDELEKDKVKLQLLKREGQLDDLNAERNIFEYFDTALPNRRLKPMNQQQSIGPIFDEIQNSLKGLLDPNCFFFVDDDVKFEIFRTTITESGEI